MPDERLQENPRALQDLVHLDPVDRAHLLLSQYEEALDRIVASGSLLNVTGTQKELIDVELRGLEAEVVEAKRTIWDAAIRDRGKASGSSVVVPIIRRTTS